MEVRLCGEEEVLVTAEDSGGSVLARVGAAEIQRPTVEPIRGCPEAGGRTQMCRPGQVARTVPRRREVTPGIRGTIRDLQIPTAIVGERRR